MKDIIITGRRQRIELWILLGTFVVANILNFWAIRFYDAPVREMLTSFFYVLTFTVFLYALTVVVRLLIYGIILIVKSSNKTVR